MTLNVPAGLPRTAAMFLVRETLRVMGVAQGVDVMVATCFCGVPVELPTLAAVATGIQVRAAQTARVGGRAVGHGA